MKILLIDGDERLILLMIIVMNELLLILLMMNESIDVDDRDEWIDMLIILVDDSVDDDVLAIYSQYRLKTAYFWIKIA